jgi:hypothetical protein
MGPSVNIVNVVNVVQRPRLELQWGGFKSHMSPSESSFSGELVCPSAVSRSLCHRAVVHRSDQCVSQIFRTIWPMVDLAFLRVILQSEQFLFQFWNVITEQSSVVDSFLQRGIGLGCGVYAQMLRFITLRLQGLDALVRAPGVVGDLAKFHSQVMKFIKNSAHCGG